MRLMVVPMWAWLSATLFLFVSTFPANAQGKSKRNLQPNSNKVKLLSQPVPGYRHMEIEGFDLLVSEVILEKNEDSNYKRKPLEVLELELKIIASIMTPAALRVLHKLVIWADWDSPVEKREFVAVYYGGHQLAMLKKGQHPLRANNISILRMKSLTKEHQPEADSGRCVLLHEIAHAVHHQLIGYDNSSIKAAFAQALERKLVDKSTYAATNEKEFFAEMTCAYLDRLHYYPHTRADLETHDPVTFRLMKSVWGKAKRAENTAFDPRNEGDKFSLAISYAGMNLGNPMVGPPRTPDQFKGKVVLFAYWAPKLPSAVTVLEKMQSWHDEMADLGLEVVGFNVLNAPENVIREAANTHGVEFSIFGRVFPSGPKEVIKLPHAMLFDNTGRCIFRGGVLAAETPMRRSLGNLLLQALEGKNIALEMEPIVTMLKEGSPPSIILRRVTALKDTKNKSAMKQAQLLLHRLTEPARVRLAQAEELAPQDPVAAYLRLENVSVRYKGTPEASRANQFIARLKHKKAVAAELNARTYLKAMRKLDSQLASREGSSNPKNATFQQANAKALQQMRGHLQRLQRDYPETPATQAASRIGAKYGLSGP
jgi:toxin lethal factor